MAELMVLESVDIMTHTEMKSKRNGKTQRNTWQSVFEVDLTGGCRFFELSEGVTEGWNHDKLGQELEERNLRRVLYRGKKVTTTRKSQKTMK